MPFDRLRAPREIEGLPEEGTIRWCGYTVLQFSTLRFTRYERRFTFPTLRVTRHARSNEDREDSQTIEVEKEPVP